LGSGQCARVVARAWTDPDFKRCLLENGKAAVAELGFTMPEHYRHLVVLKIRRACRT
jgi:nitrile hydratase